MKDKILKKYLDLYHEIQNNYNQIRIIDYYDYTTYTYIYLNKNNSFDKFKELWNKFIGKMYESDYSFDEKIDLFEDKYKDKFDFVKITIEVYTDHVYELEI